MTCSRVTPQGLLSVTDDPAAVLRYSLYRAPVHQDLWRQIDRQAQAAIERGTDPSWLGRRVVNNVPGQDS